MKPCPESQVGPHSEFDNTFCEWGKNWDWLKGLCMKNIIVFSSIRIHYSIHKLENVTTIISR